MYGYKKIWDYVKSTRQKPSSGIWVPFLYGYRGPVAKIQGCSISHLKRPPWHTTCSLLVEYILQQNWTWGDAVDEWIDPGFIAGRHPCRMRVYTRQTRAQLLSIVWGHWITFVQRHDTLHTFKCWGRFNSQIWMIFFGNLPKGRGSFQIKKIYIANF